MISVFTGALLLLCILIVHRSSATQPLQESRPLNIEGKALPLPWAGHASSIFSLNALFGAYLVTFVAVGLSATIGIAVGSITGLVFIYRFMTPFYQKTFEDVIASFRISSHRTITELSWTLLIATQLAYAVSELLILRGLSINVFYLTPRQATTFCLGVCLVGYLYTMLGGYAAVFKTDIVQFIVIAVMCGVLAVAACTVLFKNPHYWENALGGMNLNPWAGRFGASGLARNVVEFFVGTSIGLSFLLASPDTWKRVFAAAQGNQKRFIGFIKLAVAGLAPFAALLPVVLVMPRPNSANDDFFAFMHGLADQRLLLLCVALGLTGAFLSSFDSALITSVHMSLIGPLKEESRTYLLGAFHFKMGGFFLVIVFGFIAFSIGVKNPYAIGVLIAGNYAFLAGIFVGTKGFSAPIVRRQFLWASLVLIVLWFNAALSRPALFERPDVSHLTLAPIGAVIFFASAVCSWLATFGKRGGD